MEISAGNGFSTGIKTDNTLWMWTDVNVTGTGVVLIPPLIPKKVFGIGANWKSISAGGMHYMAIQTNGTLWGFGRNALGQLGIGPAFSGFAAQVGTSTSWQSVASGAEHTIALQANGTLWAWGDNGRGQLGDGTTTGRNTPVQIGTDTDWQSVSTYGRDMAAAIKTNGTLWVWGSDNGSGNLGLGAGTFTTILPTQVGVDTDWKMVSVGDGHCMALKTNGSLWTWGNNTSGQLGDGSNTARLVPLQIGTATDWQIISAGSAHSMGIKTSGILWTWGSGGNGRLGHGNNTSTNVPVQLGTATDWQRISAGPAHSLAMKTTGSLWSWGSNFYAQLGDGTTVDRNYPVEITSIQVTTSASSATVCAGSPVTFTASGATSYTWTGGISNGVPFVPASSATYTVTGSDAAGCYGVSTVTVKVIPFPSLSMSSSTIIVAGTSTPLTASSTVNNYSWYPATGLSCTTCPDPIASPGETTTYCVTSADGACADTACVMVEVELPCTAEFFLPNAFSPNGDGNNDVFCVQGKIRCISNFQMIVYDRWGEKVFESSDLSLCWDGTYRGKALGPDVFVYYIKAQDQNQKEMTKKGNVTLLK